MDAKSFLFLGCWVLGMAYPVSAEDTVKETQATPSAITEQTSVATTAQPDPYKNVTWDSVTKKSQGQSQNITIYDPKTRQPDFVSVNSTGTGTPVNVAVAVPQQTRRPKKWFFW